MSDSLFVLAKQFSLMMSADGGGGERGLSSVLSPLHCFSSMLAAAAAAAAAAVPNGYLLILLALPPSAEGPGLTRAKQSPRRRRRRHFRGREIPRISATSKQTGITGDEFMKHFAMEVSILIHNYESQSSNQEVDI